MGPFINLRRLKAILNAAIAEENAAPSAGLLEKVQDRVLWNSVLIMTMLTLAIVFLMTVKLAWIGSVITIAVAIVLGFILANIMIGRASSIEVPSTNKKSNSIN